MKIFKRFLLGLAILLGLLVLTGVIIANFYEDEVKQFAVSELNKHLNAEVSVEDIELSLLDRFPYASLNFTEVYVKDTTQIIDTTAVDTLFYAKDLYLEFNIIDIFKENYTVKQVEAENGVIKLGIDRAGNDNYHFWKQSTDTSASAFSFGLDKVALTDFALIYNNQLGKQDISAQVNDMVLSGDFSKESFSLQASAGAMIHQYASNNVTYIRSRPSEIALTLEVNNAEKTYQIQQGKLLIQSLPFKVNGSVAAKENHSVCDITVQGDQMKIETLFGMLPPHLQQKMEGYDSKGNIQFNATISGEVSKSKQPDIVANFEVSNAELTQRSTNVTLKQLQLTGSYSHTKKLQELNISNLTAVLGDGNVAATIKLTDFNNAQLSVSLNGNISLTYLQQFVTIESLEYLEGDLQVDAKFNSKVKDLKNFTPKDFRKANTTGNIDFSNVNMKFKAHPLDYRQLKGTFILYNNDAAIKDFTGNIGTTDFRLEGFFRNFLAYLFLKEQDLSIEANFKSDRLNLNEFLDNNSTGNGEAYTLQFPKDINFNLNASIGALEFRRFRATRVNGIIKHVNQVLYANPISLHCMDGTVVGDIEINGTQGDGFLVTCNTNLSKLNIEQLFDQFENFGQKFIRNDHLKGSMNADIKFASVFDQHLTIDKDKIYTFANLTITDGELIQFQPMKQISAYMRNHLIIKTLIRVDEFEKKLDHVKFSTLTNQIEIKNKTIYMPQMEIESSVMGIKISGSHSFDNHIDYHLQFRLAELLTRKTETEFGQIQDDGLGSRIFISMQGTTDNPEFSYDKKGRKEQLKEDIAKEKQNLKAILNEEFGWFKKDTTKKRIEEEKPKQQFLIEWDEFESDSTETPTNTPKEDPKKPDDNNKKGVNKFLDKLKGNKEEKKEQEEWDEDFEEDDDY